MEGQASFGSVLNTPLGDYKVITERSPGMLWENFPVLQNDLLTKHCDIP